MQIFQSIPAVDQRLHGRSAVRDRIKATCLFSPYNHTIAFGTTWGTLSGPQMLDQFKDLTIDAGVVVQSQDGSHYNPPTIDIFCRTFNLNGTFNMQRSFDDIVTTAPETQFSISGLPKGQMKLRNATHPSFVSCGGPSIGRPFDTGNVRRRQNHSNILTEMQYFLSNQPHFNPDQGETVNTDLSMATARQEQFISAIFGASGAVPSFGPLIGGYPTDGAGNPAKTSRPGGHIRIWALEKATIGATGDLNANGFSNGAGGGCVEVISNHIEIIPGGKITAHGHFIGNIRGGAGGVFLYSNKYTNVNLHAGVAPINVSARQIGAEDPTRYHDEEDPSNVTSDLDITGSVLEGYVAKYYIDEFTF